MAEENQTEKGQSETNEGDETPAKKERPKVAETAGLSSFYGKKAGMTRIFDEKGNHVPVSVIQLIPNYVTQVKTADKDGYQAYQLGYEVKREKLINNPKKGHLKKAQIQELLNRFSEVPAEQVDESLLGRPVSYEKFSKGSYVDVTGTSKGKGFQGVVKRFGFSGGFASHGSKLHRATGSVGMATFPGRIYKQRKMPGRMGNQPVTTQNLQVVEVNEEKGYLLVKGAVPGAKQGLVKVAAAVKKA